MKGERHGAQNVQEKVHGQAGRQGAQRLQSQGRLAAFAAIALALALGAQLGAQTLTNVIVAWDPNPAIENVTSYNVSADGGTAISVPATACTASVCQATVPGLALGTHSITVTAMNDWGTGPGGSVTFSITVPTVVKTIKVKKG